MTARHPVERPAQPRDTVAVTVDPPEGTHYSYALYADREMAERFDALRFGGPIGGLLAEAQEEILATVLPTLTGATVVDVGTGTGRAALALARRGATVTGVDASREMLEVAERRARADGVAVTFGLSDAHALGFADRSFDVAVSLRVLMHTPGWRRCLAELCRVARHRVVFDYPALVSVAAVQAVARRLSHALGARTEPYRVFRSGQIVGELSGYGFRVVAIHRQFVLPIALHKRVGSRRMTERIEGALSAAGLLRVMGSPVTIVAERCAS